jgi:hypothetical protein
VLLRIVANLAALVALAALGLAVGDFASDPTPLGALGLALLVVLIGAACARLYRPGGPASRRPAPPRAAPADPVPEPAASRPRRRPSTRPTSAPLWSDDDPHA